MNYWTVILDHIDFFDARDIVYLLFKSMMYYFLLTLRLYIYLIRFSAYYQYSSNFHTESFLSDDCNFLSSVVAVWRTTFFFRRCVPLPPTRTWAWSFANFSAFIFYVFLVPNFTDYWMWCHVFESSNTPENQFQMFINKYVMYDSNCRI